MRDRSTVTSVIDHLIGDLIHLGLITIALMSAGVKNFQDRQAFYLAMHRHVNAGSFPPREKLSNFYLLETILSPLLQILDGASNPDTGSVPTPSAGVVPSANLTKTVSFWDPRFSELFQTLKKQTVCSAVWDHIVEVPVKIFEDFSIPNASDDATQEIIKTLFHSGFYYWTEGLSEGGWVQHSHKLITTEFEALEVCDRLKSEIKKFKSTNQVAPVKKNLFNGSSLVSALLMDIVFSGYYCALVNKYKIIFENHEEFTSWMNDMVPKDIRSKFCLRVAFRYFVLETLRRWPSLFPAKWQISQWKSENPVKKIWKAYLGMGSFNPMGASTNHVSYIFDNTGQPLSIISVAPTSSLHQVNPRKRKLHISHVSHGSDNAEQLMSAADVPSTSKRVMSAAASAILIDSSSEPPGLWDPKSSKSSDSRNSDESNDVDIDICSLAATDLDPTASSRHISDSSNDVDQSSFVGPSVSNSHQVNASLRIGSSSMTNPNDTLDFNSASIGHSNLSINFRSPEFSDLFVVLGKQPACDAVWNHLTNSAVTIDKDLENQLLFKINKTRKENVKYRLQSGFDLWMKGKKFSEHIHDFGLMKREALAAIDRLSEIKKLEAISPAVPLQDLSNLSSFVLAFLMEVIPCRNHCLQLEKFNRIFQDLQKFADWWNNVIPMRSKFKDKFCLRVAYRYYVLESLRCSSTLRKMCRLESQDPVKQIWKAYLKMCSSSSTFSWGPEFLEFLGKQQACIPVWQHIARSRVNDEKTPLVLQNGKAENINFREGFSSWRNNAFVVRSHSPEQGYHTRERLAALNSIKNLSLSSENRTLSNESSLVLAVLMDSPKDEDYLKFHKILETHGNFAKWLAKTVQKEKGYNYSFCLRVAYRYYVLERLRISDQLLSTLRTSGNWGSENPVLEIWEKCLETCVLRTSTPGSNPSSSRYSNEADMEIRSPKSNLTNADFQPNLTHLDFLSKLVTQVLSETAQNEAEIFKEAWKKILQLEPKERFLSKLLYTGDSKPSVDKLRMLWKEFCEYLGASDYCSSSDTQSRSNVHLDQQSESLRRSIDFKLLFDSASAMLAEKGKRASMEWLLVLSVFSFVIQDEDPVWNSLKELESTILGHTAILERINFRYFLIVYRQSNGTAWEWTDVLRRKGAELFSCVFTRMRFGW